MAAIRGRNTQPELVVRRLLHAMGYRFRLHRRDLPGTPDIVLPSRKAIIDVRGCFWHRHPGCRFTTTPATRRDFWKQKFDANIARDLRNEIAARSLGWWTLVVWECETADLHTLRKKVVGFLDHRDSACGYATRTTGSIRSR